MLKARKGDPLEVLESLPKDEGTAQSLPSSGERSLSLLRPLQSRALACSLVLRPFPGPLCQVTP